MRDGWLSDEEWRRFQAAMPVACVDVLPLAVRGGSLQVGLIRRDTPFGKPGWCLVGGRLLRNETLSEGATRQIRETLGGGMRFEIAQDARPIYVAQYFPTRTDAGLPDPRQHALGITFAVAMDGQAVPQGEATDFQWFEAALGLPATQEFGFQQDKVVRECLAALGVAMTKYPSGMPE